MAECGLNPERLDLSPGLRTRGVAYHATRLRRSLAGFVRILIAPLNGRRRYVMSVDGGGGLAYNILLVLAVRLSGQAVLLYHHSTNYVLADSALMRLLLAMVGRRTRHVFCSAQMAALFRERYGSTGPIMIVSNAAWVDPQPSGTGSADGVCLGFLSSLTLEKGLGRALDTLRASRLVGLDARLLLAGALTNVPAQILVQQAKAEFGTALEVRGVLQGKAREEFYAALDVFLFPSLYAHETQSLVVPEALAAGTPVIAYDHRYVGEMVGQGTSQGGMLIPVADDFVARATDFIAAGQDEAVRGSRRVAALTQYQVAHSQAEGQVEQLIAWASGAA